MNGAAPKLRIDKWLWHARFFKTRSLAATRVGDGAVRINGTAARKRASMVGPGDVLTFSVGDRVRVIRIEALGTRRGPAPEAEALYTDLSPPAAEIRDRMPENPSYDGKGRPTKKDRRKLDLSKSRHLE
ncbi:RNA-binding protein S4 [Sulfitobacter alexandrii]|uniref:RNA-binding protein S4 n=1 Tax=Sulfitobacter alexandrii TaxID=1917485 RepID=A0A1J0WIB7_9RHOB|nr:RNA-binding S4 domain-containing protein [Sulfitobacter alexandrii]APE44065.1 RNA-binding protein S4 [Sulfitobacter alexandrii]